MMKDPVDAVITWVDGNDKAHQQKLANYFNDLTIPRPESAAPTRFNQRGEIDYCVKSLLRFAPWIRTIYIVTDAQIPAIISQLEGAPEAKKIRLVDHREIFSGFEHYLPTFNSLSIESVLWRIKGLANHFIYLNDDCSLIRPVCYHDFFQENKVILRGVWKLQTEKRWSYRIEKLKQLFSIPQKICFNEHRNMQEKSAQLAGWNRHFFHLPHAPFPLIKRTLEHYFAINPDSLVQNISYALRHPQQFWAISLAHHLEIKKENVIFDNHLQAIMVNGAFHSLKKIKQRLTHAEQKKEIAFICIQSIDAAPKATQNLLFDWLGKIIN